MLYRGCLWPIISQLYPNNAVELLYLLPEKVSNGCFKLHAAVPTDSDAEHIRSEEGQSNLI